MKYIKMYESFSTSPLEFGNTMFREADWEKEIENFLYSHNSIAMSDSEIKNISNMFEGCNIIESDHKSIILAFKGEPHGFIMTIEKHTNRVTNGYSDDIYLASSATYLPTKEDELGYALPGCEWVEDDYGDQFYYICDEIDGLEEYSEYVKKEWMRPITMYKESVESDELVKEMDRDEMKKWLFEDPSMAFTANQKTTRPPDVIDNREKSLINEFIKKVNSSDPGNKISFDARCDILEKTSWILINFNREKGRPVYCLEINISKYTDDWFLCSETNQFHSSKYGWESDDEATVYYLCDQVDGLEELLDDIYEDLPIMGEYYADGR